MADKKLSEFNSASIDDVLKLVVLYDDGGATRNGLLDFQSWSATLPTLSANNTFTGNNTFSGNVSFGGTLTFSGTLNASISGTAAKATADANNNTISTTYAKLASANTFSGGNSFTGNNTFSGNNTYSGSNTFSGSVGLGGSATATTPSTTDNDTSVATSAMVQMAFANAINTPRDVTILWGNGTAVSNPTAFDLSEPFTNFEQIGYYCGTGDENAKYLAVQSTYWLDWALNNTPNPKNVAMCVLPGSRGIQINSYNHASKPSTTTKFQIYDKNTSSYYIFGINRKVASTPNPFQTT